MLGDNTTATSLTTLSSSHRRQRSGESPSNSRALKVASTWNQISRKIRHRKNSSISTGPSEIGWTDSRTSSMTSISYGNHWTPSQQSLDLQASPPRSPVLKGASDALAADPHDRRKICSTPLLPPLLSGTYDSPDRSQSFHQQTYTTSHSRTCSNISHSSSDGHITLHSRNSSTASDQIGSRSAPLSPTSSKSPHTFPLLPQPSDVWSKKLGHANFNITPEPYMPTKIDQTTCQRLVDDYQTATTEYLKHRVRTIENYGQNSKVFQLTEDKWTETDYAWKRIINQVMSFAKATGDQGLIPILSEPSHQAPATHPYLDSKFPKLGDGEIVGPMTVDIQSTPVATTASRSQTLKHKPSSSKIFGVRRLNSIRRRDRDVADTR